MCGAKLHVILDPDADRPVYAAISAARVNDITVAQAMPMLEKRGAFKGKDGAKEREMLSQRRTVRRRQVPALACACRTPPSKP